MLAFGAGERCRVLSRGSYSFGSVKKCGVNNRVVTTAECGKVVLFGTTTALTRSQYENTICEREIPAPRKSLSEMQVLGIGAVCRGARDKVLFFSLFGGLVLLVGFYFVFFISVWFQRWVLSHV